MSKLERLIQQYCPDGVEWKALYSITKQFSGMTGVSNKWAEEGNCVFIDYNNVYNHTSVDTTALKKATVKSLKQNTLKKGDILFTSASETPDECALSSVIEKDLPDGVFLDDHLFGLRLLDEYSSVISPSYLKYAFRSEQFRFQIKKVVRGATRHYVSKVDFMKLEIPVPPLPVQEEIVRILDTFTELQAELQAELQKRLQQYNYYRDNLLSVYSDSNTVRILELQQCVSPDCSMSYGVVQPGEDFIGGIPVVRPVDLSGRIIHNKGIKTVKPLLLKAYSRTELKGGELLVCVRGTTGVVAFAGEDLKGGNVTRGIVPLRFNPLVNSNYMYHLFNSRFVKKQIENKTQGAALQQINVGDLKKISIPLPPLEEQNRIVSILDRFDALTNDLTSGLPAEMEKRRQQYEYYRDRLLTFKRL